MDDYIKRSDAINRLQEIANDYEDARDMDAFYVADYCLKHVMEIRPAADVRPIVKGEWIKNKDRVGWHCSVCKADNNFAYSWNSETGKVEFQDNYCPCCGADMRGTDE